MAAEQWTGRNWSRMFVRQGLQRRKGAESGERKRVWCREERVMKGKGGKIREKDFKKVKQTLTSTNNEINLRDDSTETL